MSSAEVRYLKINFDEILSKLRDYAKNKARVCDARAIVLTGSLANGTYTATSDADILVIADNVPAEVIQRYTLFAEPRMPIDVEPRVYTTKEFVKKFKEGDPFALEAVRLGVVLHGEQFFQDLGRSLGKQSAVSEPPS